MPPSSAGKKQVITKLNKALGWELRAQAMYAHYAVYLKGLDSLTLKSHFEEEATESFGHAAKVRDIIGQLGGEAVTTRDPAPIVHTTDTRTMLEEALKTERAAADSYRKILPLVKGNTVFVHALTHILMDEMNAVVEAEALLGR